MPFWIVILSILWLLVFWKTVNNNQTTIIKYDFFLQVAAVAVEVFIDSGRWRPFLTIRVLLQMLHFSCFWSCNVQWSFFYRIRVWFCVLLHTLNVSEAFFFFLSWLVVCSFTVAQVWDILRAHWSPLYRRLRRYHHSVSFHLAFASESKGSQISRESWFSSKQNSA